ncbi:MAG: histidine triad nucleotide-binding protein, partial [Planctomycetota bacterium]
MADAPSDCLFCKIVAKEIEAKIVHEDEDTLAFRDINPQAPTHVLVIPKRHVTCLDDLEPGDDALAGKLIRTGVGIAKKEGHAGGPTERGYRLVFNAGPDTGYSVFHIHLHVLGGRTMTW